MGDLVDGVRSWLQKSGRALELRVARELQQTGHADVQQSFTYQDVVTATTREGDVRASFSWTGPGGVPCSITLAVECKSGAEHPWVAFHTGAPPDGAGTLEDWVVFAHGPFVGITEPLTGR